MVRVAILGATGYTALELIKLLLRHPEVEITVLTSRQEGNPHVGTVHPALVGRLDLRLEDLGAVAVAARADCVFSCLPHGVTATVVPQLLATGVKVIDFSADYRLDDSATFRQWYGEEHPDGERLGKVVYGLPELFREQIVKAQLVANPGCYPTSAILPLAALLKTGLIEPTDIIVDSKSGVSGAGRTPKLTTFEQIVRRAAGREINIIFTPHLIPMDRGILTTAYSKPIGNVTEEKLFNEVREFYADEPFVRVVDHLPGTKDSVDTNFCDITFRLVRGRVLSISCLDNLIKGASGAAVQNFNLMYGFDETTALL
jgi:N-acetyl-gamma-glutamyl-phosphate reductase